MAPTRRRTGPGRPAGASVVAKDGFISARSIKGEYSCLDGADRLTLRGGKDGRFEYVRGKAISEGTYYADDNEGAELVLKLSFPGAYGEQTAIVDLKRKTFAAFLVKKAADAGAAAESESAWARYVHETGDAYWYNAATEESRWEVP
jgi:hypothetical protein